MKLPKVTIGIPCFNAERWLGECVQSALEQTWQNKEIIVVDNGSTDGSRDIIHQFGDRISSVVISERGANRARNEILRRSTGDWIQYLDADDYLLPDKLTSQLEEGFAGTESMGAKELPEVGVLYSPVLIEEHGNASISEIDRNLDLAAQWISWQLPQTGACLWHKNTLENLGGWNEKMPCCQEHELYLRAIEAGVHFQFTPTARAVYRIWSDETLCRKDPLLVIRTRTELIDQMLAWLGRNGRLMQSHTEVAGKAFFEMARTWARHDLDQATLYLKEKQTRRLLHLSGRAAPPFYRVCFNLFGFKNAERLAKFLRNRKSTEKLIH